MRREEVSIVLAGDDSETLITLKEHLESQHFSATVANDVKHARQLMWQLQPHILFVGMADPEQAREVVIGLREALSKEAYQHNHAFIVCGSDHVDDAVRQVLSGQFEDYIIVRPFVDPQRLAVIIHQALRCDKLQDSLRKARSQLRAGGEQAKSQADACNTVRKKNEKANSRTESAYEKLGVDVEGLIQAALKGGLGNRQKQLSEVPEPLRAHAEKMLAKLFEDFGTQLRANLSGWAQEIQKQHAGLTALAQDLEDEGSTLGYVLIVDDNPLDAKIMRKWVEQEGYTTQVAKNAYEAFKLAKQSPPAIALIDLYMPGMDGAVASTKLRALPGLADLPVAIVSASKSRDAIKKAVAARVSAYLCKPLSKEAFIGKVNNLISAGF